MRKKKMTDLQSMPLNRAEIAAQRDKEDLLDDLDDLLEHYLLTLHEYHKVMGELTTQLSSGYMALAQANFHNSSSAIRYGQDCYDERMQAIRKVHIAEHGRLLSDRPHFSIHPPDVVAPPSRKTSDAEQEEHEQNDEQDEPSSSAIPKPTDKAETTPDAGQRSNPDPKQTEQENKKSSEKIADPLKWFGILVPPALRTAQSTFVDAVEGPIPQLATIAKDLRMQEIEIGRVRKQIKKM
ncbi:ATP synthase subunit D domain-containing [Pyrenophora seminiperda CCB06]|uniref:Vacuolar ATPase assembly protein VMA22 n=1 Tax=Pyrenophora seminiperda CCB06 TaxID=1302712 RepID=A0A3M7MEH3_9PLEO|nr:ATP synthase subunit D domain-containing [Pyrenophora seminiperda CCB06]